LNAPEVIPPPTNSSLADVVVTLPLVTMFPVPEFDEAASKGLRASRPLYSAMRTSAYGTRSRIER
jgi:hypothetical protein